MPRRRMYDRWLFFTTGFLVVVGLLMVGSASTDFAMDHGADPALFGWKHLLHLAFGLTILLAALSIDYRVLDHRGLLIGGFLALVVALAFALTMPASGGASRWIPVGPLKFQPSEFAKLFIVVFFAHLLARNGDRLHDPRRSLLPALAVLGTLCFLVYRQPDLGTVVLMVAVSGLMLFLAGLRWSYMGLVLLASSVVFVVGVLSQPYRVARLRTFLDPDLDPLGAGFQLNQSLIAVGSGGLFGTGIGRSHQKFYLPAAHTDFVFAVVGEELGFIGAVALLSAFMIILWRGLRTAARAPERFGSYLAAGATGLLVMQGMINMSVGLGLLPTKGLSLPLVSYGGSSMLASMLCIGLLLNVSQHAN